MCILSLRSKEREIEKNRGSDKHLVLLNGVEVELNRVPSGAVQGKGKESE